MNIKKQMDKIYADIPLENIPWNILKPPEIMVKAVESGRIKPCRVADLGCGAGNYSVWLAKKGFDVTGFDISPKAIKHAQNLAAEKGIKCRFEVCDLLQESLEFQNSFDLAIDWEVLHHIFPKDRHRFLENVRNLLRPQGIYLSVCFSEKDLSFGGTGKFRTTPLGTTLYLSSKKELTDLFSQYFKIEELSSVEIQGKYGLHIVNLAWLSCGG
jgi:2-polyprenyl-3-methyl-5-hydroxy-6-metoxy-1,4-benzoquinol methylase